MINHRTIIIGAAAALMACACSDISELREQVSSLDSRVSVLENVVSSLNDNIKALSALANAGTIYSCEEKDGIYTITLSDGQVITLRQGTEGSVIVPVITMDEEGYWMADYQDGKGPQYIMCNGNKVQSKGETGNTPVFRISDDNCWQVSYDGGSTYSYVPGADGQKVECIAGIGEGGDTFFNSVTYDEENGKFILELKDGKEISVPVVTGFLCSIEAEGTQVFDYGQTRTWFVRTEGVRQAIVTAPDGWACRFDENILSVTAPSVQTKSLAASNRTDVCIIAFSPMGLTAVAKVCVVLEGTSVMTPAVAATVDEVTVSTAAVSVAVSNAESWKYMLRTSDEAIPSASEILTDGIEGTGSSLLLTDLYDGTEYRLSLIAAAGDIHSEVVSLTFTTEAVPVTSYYEAWEAGRAITIDGVRYSKETWGATGVSMHITEDYTFTDSNAGQGFYFIDPGVTFTIKPSGAVSKMFIIGNDPSQRADVVFGGQMQFYEMGSSEGTNRCAFFNVNVDALTFNNYVMKVNNAKYFDALVFDSCHIMPASTLIYSRDSDRGFKYFAVVNSEVEVTKDGTQFVNAQPGTSSWGTVKYDNTIWYSASKRTNFYMFQGTNGSSDLTIENMVVTNNTIFNLHPKTDFYCHAGTIRNAVVTGNLCYWEDAPADAEGFLRCRVQYPDAGTANSNVYYSKAASTRQFQIFFGGISNGFTGADEAVKLEEDPFSSYNASECSFVKKAEYVDFGAKR